MGVAAQMNAGRIIQFDILRTIAIGMILACHFIRSIGFHQLDIPLGCIGNMIFFVMSGWLLGLAWESKLHPVYGWQFLKRRLLRLAVPLWLFAIPYLIWFKASGHTLTAKDAFLNLAFCNWFARIPGMTPYWFITAITAFYIAVIALTRVKRYEAHPFVVASILVISAVLIQMFLSLCGIRYGYVLVMMLCGALAFLNANRLLSFLKKAISSPVIVLIKSTVGVILFLVFWWLVCEDVLVVGTPLCYYATIPIAFCITVFAFALPAATQKTVVSFISSISYEVYLVHAAMLIWTKPISANIAIYAVLFLAGTLVFAILLHYLSSLTVKCITGRNA